ncbi:MAG: extracellular solute-binding protein [Nitrosomonadales bacterium]
MIRPQAVNIEIERRDFGDLSKLCRSGLFGVVLVLMLPLSALAADSINIFGKPKYNDHFKSFEYVNPDAPKGGTLTLAVSSSFDKLNPYNMRGKIAPGLTELMFETLTIYSLDEPATQYGLLADDIAVAKDMNSVTFHINPKARFNNGDPVTAADVKYSFDTLTGRKAAPKFRLYFADIEQAVVVDPLTVRFEFGRPGRDLPLLAGTLPVFSRKWGRSADGSGKKGFDELQTETPITSGPYRIESVDYSRGSITYSRNPDYWAKDLPVRRGSFNFDHIAYKLYRDGDLQAEAFRAGEFDVQLGDKARNWCCLYKGGKFDSGELVKKYFPHKNVPGMNGYVFNLRRERFRDVRVRQALGLAFDFEWANKNIFYGEYQHPYSYFSNSPLAASGLPSQDELKLLEPYRDSLDPAVFGPMVEMPSTAPPGSLRDNLIKGQQLLSEAGWNYRDGALRNDKGEPFVLEAGMTVGIPYPRIETYMRNLSRYGIVIKRRMRDAVSSKKAMDNFDYDMNMIMFGDSRIPGSDFYTKLNSADADVAGSDNIIGLKSPAVDALIEKLANARSGKELTTVAHALDRVLMHGYYVVPERYSFEHRIAYKSALSYPATLPSYYTPGEWVLTTWWDGRK